MAKVHIIYMGERPQGDFSVASIHHSMLANVLGSTSSAKESLIYSYGGSFNGFAAKLTDEEAARFSEMEGVISVIPNHILKLHTKRSWDFMGFTQDKVGAPQEGEVIIGLLDSGIWPESAIFNDKGLTAPPAKWKGTCQGENFTCNNVTIEPSALSFSAVGEQKSFTVKVYGPKISQQPIMSGAISWKDAAHEVRSPLVVYNILPGSTYSSYSMTQKKPKFKGSSMYHKNGIPWT